MMGERTVTQEALFYEFSVERHVPADHLLRSIDSFVELSSKDGDGCSQMWRTTAIVHPSSLARVCQG
jgi:hypothetical protein